MAKNKVPKMEINLSTLCDIKEDNNIWDTEDNRAVLQQFEQMRSDSKVWIQFKPFVEYQHIKDGNYRIVPAYNPTKIVGIRKGKYSDKLMQLVSTEDYSFDNIWHIKHLDNNEYAIFTHNQQEILAKGDSDKCRL